MPVNPYFAGDALHYYWMPHVLTGVQYRFAGAWATLDELLLIRSIAIDLFFVAFLYGIVAAVPRAAMGGGERRRVRDPVDELRRALCAVRFLVARMCRSARSGTSTSTRSAAGISRAFRSTACSGCSSISRITSSATCIGLIGLLALAVRTRAVDAAAFAVSGVCLALSIAISSFAGLMVTVAAMLYEFVGVAAHARLDARRHPRDRRRPFRWRLGGARLRPRLRRSQRRGRGADGQPRRRASILVGDVAQLRPDPDRDGAGNSGARRPERRGLAVLGALAVDVARLLFLRQRPRSPGRLCRLARRPLPVHVGGRRDRRAARILHASPSATCSRWHWAAIVVAFLAGLPTTIIDIYNTQDITESRRGRRSLDADAAAGRTAGLRLDRAEHAAGRDRSRSIRCVATRRRWAYLPAFAERRMAIGLPISMVPLAKYQQGSEAIRHDVRRAAARRLRARRPRAA